MRGTLLVAAAALAAAAPPMPQAYIDRDGVSTSGISAGAFMAIQLQVAFSSLFAGSGALAGGPYYCAQGQLADAELCMNLPLSINVNVLADVIALYAAAGDIDGTGNLTTSRAWFFSATGDTVVNPGTVSLAVTLMQQFMPASAVTFVNTYPGEHAQQTLDYGNACSNLGSPYIKCVVTRACACRHSRRWQCVAISLRLSLLRSQQVRLRCGRCGAAVDLQQLADAALATGATGFDGSAAATACGGRADRGFRSDGLRAGVLQLQRPGHDGLPLSAGRLRQQRQQPAHDRLQAARRVARLQHAGGGDSDAVRAVGWLLAVGRRQQRAWHVGALPGSACAAAFAASPPACRSRCSSRRRRPT